MIFEDLRSFQEASERYMGVKFREKMRFGIQKMETEKGDCSSWFVSQCEKNWRVSFARSGHDAKDLDLQRFQPFMEYCWVEAIFLFSNHLTIDYSLLNKHVLTIF